MNDWAKEKGIANEPEFDILVERLGGKRVDTIISNPILENADYFFPKQHVVMELKILEKEFGSTEEYRRKQMAVVEKHVREHDLGGPFLGQTLTDNFAHDIVDIYRRPLSAVVKKANRQIKETKRHLNLRDAEGVLLCVNDNFRAIAPTLVMHLLCRILMGSCSSISALVYVTNHYVEVTGNDLVNLLWVPVYSDAAPDSLVQFIDTMGRNWSSLCEEKLGPFEGKVENSRSFHFAIG